MASPIQSSPPPPSPTTSSNELPTIGDIALGAERSSSEILSEQSPQRLYRTLKLLSSIGSNEIVGAYYSFFCQGHILEILSIWAEQNQIAKELHEAGIQVWSQPNLAKNLEIVSAHLLVREKLFGVLKRQYLAAMASGARPRKNEQLAVALDKFRLLALIRSIEALRKIEAVWEPHIRDVAIILRQVCDIPKGEKSNWITDIAPTATEFDDFCDDLKWLSGQEARQKTRKVDARNFFRNMSVVAAGGEWGIAKSIAELPGNSTFVHGPLANESLAPPANSSFQGWDWDRSFGSANIPAPNGQALHVFAHKTDEKQAPARNRGHGTGVMLQSLEDTLFLPSTWHHLTKEESAEFDRSLHQLARSTASGTLNRLGAAVAQICIVSCRSAHQVEPLAISETLTDDWSIHPKTGILHRRPPRFADGWTRESTRGDTEGWIRPSLQDWQVTLWQSARTAIVDTLVTCPTAMNIGELWRHISPNQSFENWFEQMLASNSKLNRLSGASLSLIAMGRGFKATPHQGFIRLIGSQPRTGLPATCAYGSYRAPFVKKALTAALANSQPALVTVTSPTNDERLNAAGSQLDIDLRKVGNEISCLVRTINELARNPTSWVKYHNKLTSLLVIALYASTGGRPINSPFQTMAWIDLKRHIIFVEDKVSGPTRSARVCVLSDVSANLITEFYLPHLLELSKFLKPNAGEFAREIVKVASSDAEASIPLFFFLKANPELDWMEVTETQLAAESAVSWPLPWNLFRHVHATELVRRGLNPEIVDALLGHGDRGAESHGDFSLRIPEEDIEAARSIVNALQADFKITAPRPLTHFPANTIPKAENLVTARTFGRSARKYQRKQSQEAARKRARREIQEAIGNRAVETISPEQWESVARSMLIRKDGLPHSAASLRYEEFEAFVESQWHDHRKLTRIRRTYSVAPEPASIFNEQCIGAPESLLRTSVEYEGLVASLTESSINVTLARALAAVDLVLRSKVSNSAVLKAIVLMQPNIKIIKFQEQYWLEWTDAETWQDGRPVFRVQVTARAARWASTAHEKSRRNHAFPPLPPPLLALSKSLDTGDDLQKMLLRLCALQDQLNAWKLPGIDAAHLSGRLMHSAIPHADWYRATQLKAPLLLGTSDAPTSDSDADNFWIEGQHKAVQSLATKSTPELCAKLFDQIRTTLQKPGVNIEAKRGSVGEALRKSGYGRGDMPYVFANFLLYLLARKSKRNARDGLRLETVDRYFSSVNRPLCDTAHDVCLSELDGDEITDLYCRMLEWWNEHYLSSSKASEDVVSVEQSQTELQTDTQNVTVGSAVQVNAQESAANHAKATPKPRLTPQQRADDAARRTLLQLRELHAFAAKKYGVEEPDWSEITNGSVGTIGRPGFVLLSEYKRSLATLLCGRDAAVISDFELTACFSLLLCARFGLRVGEAVGLYTNDWVECEGAVVLLVRANPLRSLKSENSRRQIPLIGFLDEIERKLVNEVLRRSKHVVRKGQGGPLMPGVTRDNFKGSKRDIGSAIRDVLKAVTCNPFCTAHMLRHSFATRVLATLRGFQLSSNEPFNEADTLQLRRLLLGSDQLDRRALWAVCRLLGHKSPGITARCYLHAMQSATELELDAGIWDGTGKGSKNLFNLDSVEVEITYGGNVELPTKLVTTQEPQALLLLRCWRLICQGYDVDTAILDSLVRPDIFKNFIGLSDFLKDQQNQPEDEAVAKIIASAMPDWKVPLSRLDALIAHVANAVPLETSPLAPFAIRETIGAKRQIVLFTREHFQAIDRFMRDLKLNSTDILFAKTKTLRPEQDSWISEFKLDSFLAKEGRLPTDFRIDTATTGPLHYSVSHRMAVVPNPAHEVIHTTYEMMLLWLSWYVCISFAQSD